MWQTKHRRCAEVVRWYCLPSSIYTSAADFRGLAACLLVYRRCSLMFPQSLCLMTVFPSSVGNVTTSGTLLFGCGRRCTDSPIIRSESNCNTQLASELLMCQASDCCSFVGIKMNKYASVSQIAINVAKAICHHFCVLHCLSSSRPLWQRWLWTSMAFAVLK